MKRARTSRKAHADLEIILTKGADKVHRLIVYLLSRFASDLKPSRLKTPQVR